MIDIEVRKKLDPSTVGRCNSCMNPDRPVNSIRVGMQVFRLCGECTKFLTSLLR